LFMADPTSPAAPMLTDPSQGRADGCVCGAAEARAERHLRLLEELAEIGMDLARTVQRQAHEQAAADLDAAALGLVFSRIARAVRQTVALEARLAEDRQAKTSAQIAGQTRARAARRQREVRAVVEQAIEADADESDVENLLLDLEERLVDYDESDFSDRPIGELVARICRDLGVTPDWSLWEDEDWAIEEAAARPRGSPYAARDPDPGSEDRGGDPPDKPPPKHPWRTH
ncbi:MAG TPA: hypothetical protein VGN89_13920, partial [Phenylobacterium sp.]|nr:hypothetical protein [Phenylobacterium sp.]